MSAPTPDYIRDSLRAVAWPGYDRDIVAAGFVQDIAIQDGRVTVRFAPNTRRDDKIDAMEAGIRQAVLQLDGVRAVDVARGTPAEPGPLRQGGRATPLQAEVTLEGHGADPDPLLEASAPRHDRGPSWGGRSPDQAGPATTWDGPVAVHQWDIDPTDSTFTGGDAHVVLEGWEYRMWWQVHPTELVYASIQAIRDDTVQHRGAARNHPVGRAVAVNVVYDQRRDAVVAIYGTARDFRPFVEAFRRGHLAPESAPEDS